EDLDLPLVSRHAVHPAGAGRTGHLQVATPVELAILVFGQQLLEQQLGALLGSPPVTPSPSATDGLLRQHAVRRPTEQAHDEKNEEQLQRDDGQNHAAQPPATRGTMMMCCAAGSN